MYRLPFLAGLVLLTAATTLRGELLSLDIRQRTDFAGGRSFGKVGSYEVLTGIARFGLDPNHPANRRIVDLGLARTNSKGQVEFACDVCLLAPKDPGKGNGALFYDVNNRGTKLALRFFNFAGGGNDLSRKNSEGDGFLMERGFVVVWCGWIGELLPGDDRLLLQPPIPLQDGRPLTGLVRFEMSSDKRVDSLPLSRREGHGTYTPDPAQPMTLTVRALEGDERRVVSRQQWRLKTVPIPERKDGGVPGTLPQTRLFLDGGFEPGMLYELVATARGSIVQGTGFAAVRDLVSFLRHDASKGNPLRNSEGRPVIERAHAFGVSQSGRFLRHLLWQGFNEDEKGRLVFDGLMPHVAGGGLGFFNHRFAQPTRHNGQHEDHLYPADIFPFTYGPEFDPFLKVKDGILSTYSGKKQPKVMHTQSAAEYWHRAGSLPHTDPLGKKDAVLPENVRLYAFGGTQHGPASYPPSRGNADNLANPGDYRPFLRALLVELDDWVKEGKAPPASVYPRITDGTLVSKEKAALAFPKIPGVRFPKVIQQPPYADFGPSFRKTWILEMEPPVVKGSYMVLVPAPDADGNDRGCLLPPEVAAPSATFTGWNLRRKEVGADAQLANLLGSFLPFPKTKADRLKTGEPRPALEERYADEAAYRRSVEKACAGLVRDGYLLDEDVRRAVDFATSIYRKAR